MPDRVSLRDIGVNEFLSTDWPPTMDSVLLRVGQLADDGIGLYDCAGCALLAQNIDAQVFPVSREEGTRVWAAL